MKPMKEAAARVRAGRLRLAALLCLAGLSLGACASVGPQLAVNAPPSAHVELTPVVPPAPPPPKPRITASVKPEKAGRRSRARAQAAKQGPSGGRVVIGRPYQVAGVWYTPAAQPAYDVVGIASWYGDEFNGRSTANGERFNMNATSAAHTTLPLPSIVEVTNLDNGRSLRVRLNDRGPFKPGRIIDLSRGAAERLGYLDKGLARVRVRYVGSDRRDEPIAPLYVARSARTPRGPAQPAPADRLQLAALTYPAAARRVAAPRNSMIPAYEAGMQRIAFATDARTGFGTSVTNPPPLW